MFNVFFDLDGTLVDSKEGITQSIQYALQELGHEAPHNDELSWMIGPSLIHSFHNLLEDTEQAVQAVLLYRENYIENEAMFLAEPYDGVGEMFASFQQLGAKLFVATSKPQDQALKIVEHFGIHAFIDQLFGADIDGSRSDKTELLQYAIDETNTNPAQAIMVGDRRFDIFGAKNNDMFNIGALWGYSEQDELHQAEADMLAGHPEELPEIALDLLGIELD